MMPTAQSGSQPAPAYPTPPIDKAFYQRVADDAPRTLTHTHTIPPRSGYAWPVAAGSVFRLTTPEGPQVGDLNLWSRSNPRERFWAARTRQLQRSHVSTGDRLWSSLPQLRPMATIVRDTLEGVARCHDLLGTRCDPYVNKLLTGSGYDFHCHSNLTRAVLAYGLAESDVHDVLNVFQVTGLDGAGRYCMSPSPAVAGSHLEFFAEIDLLCALSTCPGGDLSAWAWAEGEGEGEGEGGGGMVDTCRPIRVDVWTLDGSCLEGWAPPSSPDYRGAHGMRIPQGERESV